MVVPRLSSIGNNDALPGPSVSRSLLGSSRQQRVLSAAGPAMRPRPRPRPGPPQPPLWLLLLLLLGSSPAAGASDCSRTRPRRCDSQCVPGGIELLCPSMVDAVLQVKVVVDNAMLSCLNASVDYSWMEGAVLQAADKFSVFKCPLPNVPLHTFLNQLGISQISTITKLNLQSSVTGTTLNKDYLENMKQLTYLKITESELTELPNGLFQNMPNLTNLDLSYNNLTLSHDKLMDLRNLKRLELGTNKITHLRRGVFENMKKLEFLNLWSNNIQNLSRESFKGLVNVTSLDVSSNNITTIDPDTLADMTQLKYLSLLKNNFVSLPENLFSTNRNLYIIKLQNNGKLQHLPQGLFANLRHLQEVYLSFCNLSVLPEDLFWGSNNISSLYLSRNALSTLPALLFRDMKNLQELDLSRNKLTVLPNQIFTPLRLLKTLHLNHNKMTEIDNELFHTLFQLRKLHLQNNTLSEVGNNALYLLEELREIDLSYNKLKFANSIREPYGVWSPLQRCKSLQIINLSHNEIEEMFSDWLLNFNELRKLDLSYNKISLVQTEDLQFTSNARLTVNLQNNTIAGIVLFHMEVLFSPQNMADADHQLPIHVQLQNNPVQCGCNTYQVLRYRDKQMLPSVYTKLDLKLDKLVCAGPADYAGVPLEKLSRETFRCSPQATGVLCPAGCKCERWPAHASLVVNCSGAGLREAPHDLVGADYQLGLPIRLVLDNNRLHSLPEVAPPSYVHVRELSLSHNRVSWLGVNALPPHLEALSLDHNNLTQLNSSLLEKLMNTTNVTLNNNPWNCECEDSTLDFFNFLQASYKQVENLNNITCQDGRSIALLTTEDICPFVKTVIIAASTVIAVVGIVIGMLAALYFRFQNEVKVWLYAHNMCLWFVTEEELDKDKIYDAFVSYSHQDEEFVTNKLIPDLENGTPSFKLCVHIRDWIAGEFITTQIMRSVRDSKRTIVLLSQNFIKSEWGRLEFRAAHKQALTEGRARVIVILYGDIGPIDNLDSELQTYLKTNTYVKWGDPWFWDKLRYALPHPPKIQKKMIGRTDKLELINSSSTTITTTPPTDVSINPLELLNNKNKLMNGLNGYANGAVKSV